jgi:hypothetical protein
VAITERGICCKFFFLQERKQLEETSLSSGGKTPHFIQTQNFSRLFAPLIQEHYATLRELEQYYSYEDAMNLLECLYVARTNENIANDFASKQRT